jgi:hypothetical protein
MIYCFDTSAINRLHDDTERQFLVRGILATNIARVTALNVVEAAATRDEARRRSLVYLLRQLSDGVRPLCTPNTLLQIMAKAHARGDSRAMITVPEEEEGIWAVVDHPEKLGENEREEALRWKESLEDPFKESHREARPAFQSLLESGKGGRPRSSAELIRLFIKNDLQVVELTQKLYSDATGRQISIDEARGFLKQTPEWVLFYCGWGHAIFVRALRKDKFGNRHNPGTIDLWCAIYLPHCDVFVTDDVPQRRSLRVLGVLNAKRTRIMSYDEMLARLLVNGKQNASQQQDESLNRALSTKGAQCG